MKGISGVSVVSVVSVDSQLVVTRAKKKKKKSDKFSLINMITIMNCTCNINPYQKILHRLNSLDFFPLVRFFFFFFSSYLCSAPCLSFIMLVYASLE